MKRPAPRRRLSPRVLWDIALLTALAFLILLPSLDISPASGSPPEQKTGEEPRAKEIEAPFNPPPLAELGKLKWHPQRVVDSIQLLRDHLAKLPPPVPDGEALALNNTDDASNAKIAAVIGRLPKSDDEVDWDATLHRHFVAAPNSLNAILASSAYDMAIINVLYAGLMGFDWEMVPLADADTVKEWSTSEDRMMDRFVMRDDITWSDGAPFTAYDIEFSYQTIMSPHVYCPAVRSGLEDVKGVKAYDERTLVYFHKRPMGTNVWNVNFPVIPKHIYEKTLREDPTIQKSEEHVRLSRNPVTSGPYKFVSWDSGQVVVERRPEWYEKDGKRIRHKPFFKTMRFHIVQNRNTALLAFRNGELDEMELTAEQWMDQTSGADFYARGTKVRPADRKLDEQSFFFIAWNQKNSQVPFFQDRRVREALSLAFPYQEFLERVCQGLYQPAAGLFHPYSWMANPSLKPRQQDLPRARALLREAGWKDTNADGVLDKVIDGKTVEFRFTFLTPIGNPLYGRIAALLQSSLKRLGIDCNAREIEFPALTKLAQEHNYQAFVYGLGAGADPDRMRNFITTESYERGRNYVGYSNKDVDRLFDLGAREYDRDKRAEYYQKIDQIVTGDCPYTCLAFRTSLYGASRDLRGFNFSPRMPFGFSPGPFSIWKKKR